MRLFIFIILFVVSTWGENRDVKILFSGIEKGVIDEFRTSYEDELYKVWGVDPNISFVSKRDVAIVRRTLFGGDATLVNSEFKSSLVSTNDLSASGGVKKILKDYHLDSVILVVPTVVEFSIKRVRRYIIGAETQSTLSIHFLFYDVANNRELYSSTISEILHKKEMPIFWQSPDRVTPLTATEKVDIYNKLIDGSVKKSYLILKEAIAEFEKNSSKSGDSSIVKEDSNTVKIDDTTVTDSIEELSK